MCNDTEEYWRIWRGIDLSFQNWHKEFGKFWLKHLKVSKIYSLMGCFRPKFIMFELKKYRGVIFEDAREWCKVWRKTDLWFGKWHEEFGKFWPEHSKISQICTSMGCFWPKCIMFELRKYRGVMFDGTQDWYKVWRKLTFTSKNDMKNLANFYHSTWKSQNWDFNDILLSKVENTWA